MLKNSPTYFKNLALRTPQDFKTIFGHFLTLCMKELKQHCHPHLKIDQKFWSIVFITLIQKLKDNKFWDKRVFEQKSILKVSYISLQGICAKFNLIFSQTTQRNSFKFSLGELLINIFI